MATRPRLRPSVSRMPEGSHLIDDADLIPFVDVSEPNPKARNKNTTVEALRGGGTGLPPGGSTNQALIKQSGADGDADWEDIPPSPNKFEPDDLPLFPDPWDHEFIGESLADLTQRNYGTPQAEEDSKYGSVYFVRHATGTFAGRFATKASPATPHVIFGKFFIDASEEPSGSVDDFMTGLALIDSVNDKGIIFGVGTQGSGFAFCYATFSSLTTSADFFNNIANVPLFSASAFYTKHIDDGSTIRVYGSSDGRSWFPLHVGVNRRCNVGPVTVFAVAPDEIGVGSMIGGVWVPAAACDFLRRVA